MVYRWEMVTSTSADPGGGGAGAGRGRGQHTQSPPALVTRGHYSLADVVLLLLLLLLLSHHLPPRAGLDWVCAGGGEAGTLYILAPGGGTRPPPGLCSCNQSRTS